LNNYDELKLPQIIVCGIQSSGKSSVLEAITEIPFPRKGETCTRFITKVTLKPHETESVTVSIQPGVGSKTKSTGNEFPPITNLANLNHELQSQFTTAERLILGNQQSTDFSLDVLCITISGPDRPILQILDLPGLISHDAQNEANVELVQNMVETEMRKPNSTILAVVAANIDPGTQPILRLCAQIDSLGERTIGIITQPDVSPDRAETYAMIATGKSKAVKIRHQWHVLRNRTPDELKQNTTIEDRNDAERQYLAKHPWSQLGQENLGVESLRTRLSDKLLKEASQIFPLIATEARAKLSELEKELKALGGHNRTIVCKFSGGFYSPFHPPLEILYFF
jgi:GTPase SAR1 family protein